MRFKSSNNRSINSKEVNIQKQEKRKNEQFQYPGSVINKDGDIADDVTHRIQQVGFSEGLLLTDYGTYKTDRNFLQND